MVRPPIRRQLLASLALVALAWAQAFGISRGYVCDCGGVYEITVLDHCHGPHSADCHNDECATPNHHEDDGCPSDESDQDRQDHLPLKDPVIAVRLNGGESGLGVAAVVPAMPPLWTQLPTAVLFKIVATKGSGSRWNGMEGPGRMWPRVIAHAIALRV